MCVTWTILITPDIHSILPVVHQIASIISSFVSMGWAMASYHRSIRIAQEDKSNISNVGTAFQFLWHFFITGNLAEFVYLAFSVITSFINNKTVHIYAFSKDSGTNLFHCPLPLITELITE